MFTSYRYSLIFGQLVLLMYSRLAASAPFSAWKTLSSVILSPISIVHIVSPREHACLATVRSSSSDTFGIPNDSNVIGRSIESMNPMYLSNSDGDAFLNTSWTMTPKATEIIIVSFVEGNISIYFLTYLSLHEGKTGVQGVVKVHYESNKIIRRW